MTKYLAGFMLAVMALIYTPHVPQAKAAGTTYTIIYFHGAVVTQVGTGQGQGIYTEVTLSWIQKGNPNNPQTSTIYGVTDANSVYNIGTELSDWDGSPIGASSSVVEYPYVNIDDGSGSGRGPTINMSSIVTWYDGPVH